ncbi:MAG TPA: hypothetical protein PLB87_03770 [Prolixibacteraceae bacterium]|nr:hypothetical protein [Prolixibacteraceae bacterium]
MKSIKLFLLLTIIFCLKGYSQTNLPIKFRVEKQAMSTPMSSLDEAFFSNYYYSKPMNVKFDGTTLDLYFDNGMTFAKKQVTEVRRNAESENNEVTLETILYVDNSNVSDTISYIVDHTASCVQIILPSKNSKGEYVGYTCYKQFIKENQLASR